MGHGVCRSCEISATFCQTQIKDAYNVPPMPPKQMFGKTSAALTVCIGALRAQPLAFRMADLPSPHLRPDEQEQRRKMLEHYLYVLLLENDSTVAENPHVIRFFELTGKLNVCCMLCCGPCLSWHAACVHSGQAFYYTGRALRLQTNTLESRINNWCRECEDMTNLANEISANLQGT
jgi:hypothetical protein